MKISGLYIYPIKSLRGISLNEAELTPQGLEHDRRFMLREVMPDRTRRNMACYHDPKMVRFVSQFTTADGENIADRGASGIKVTYSATSAAADAENATSIVIPLVPDISMLKEANISMHGSTTTGYNMGDRYNQWFSKCFVTEVELIYVGSNRRKVLGNLSPNEWKTSSDSGLVAPDGDESVGKGHEQGLGLSDVAAVLVVSETSLQHVTRQLPEGSKGDITKFRPNIVIAGADQEFAEDYWRELDVAGKRVLLTQNCNRCVSLNLDYDAGNFSSGSNGRVLANLSKDRRIDPGAKYSPVFGRYGFLHKNAHGKLVCVGDEVTVAAANQEKTTFFWPHKVPS